MQREARRLGKAGRIPRELIGQVGGDPDALLYLLGEAPVAAVKELPAFRPHNRKERRNQRIFNFQDIHSRGQNLE